MKTDFFIVGAAKSGTTALQKYLNNHPEICMCSEKEPNYFSHEEIEKQKLYYTKYNVKTVQEYQALFHKKTGTEITGEASVSYLYYPEVASRIHRFNPLSKIIICLREPVSRAFSHYCMDYSLGLVKYRFEEIWNRGVDDSITGIYYQQYFSLSEYVKQVRVYLNVFPKEQVLILYHEEMSQNQPSFISKVHSFLGITHPNRQLAAIGRENVTTAAGNPIIAWLYHQQPIRNLLRNVTGNLLKSKIKQFFFSRQNLPVITDEFKKELQQHFLPFNKELEILLETDLSGWYNQDNS